MIVDVTNTNSDGHAGGFGFFGYGFFGHNRAIGPLQFLIVQCQMALDPDAEESLVDHHAGTDVK